MPDALEFAQWQGEQRAQANAQRMVGLAQLRQEAQRQRQFDAELMFKTVEGDKDRKAALERTVAAGTLDIEQEEARSKAYLDRLETQEKAKLLRKFEASIGPRLPGETDEQYFTRGNKLLAKQADAIFGRVTDIRKRSIVVTQREAAERRQRINRMARDTVIPTLSESERKEVAANPVAFLRILEKNPLAAGEYQRTVQRLEEIIPQLTQEGEVELGGLAVQANRLDKVGSDLIGDPDFRGAMQYFGVESGGIVPRAGLATSGASPGGASAITPEVATPVEFQNFQPFLPDDPNADSLSPVVPLVPAPVLAPANPFAPIQPFDPNAGSRAFRPLQPEKSVWQMTPQEIEVESRMRRRPRPAAAPMPFGTIGTQQGTPPEFRY